MYASSANIICPGSFVTLNSSATGTGITYQWEENGNSIIGATVPSYLTSTPGLYRCLATTNCGTSTSNAISVTSGNVPSAPAFISGPIQVCNGTLYSYAVSSVANANAYNWTVPPGLVITSNTGNSIGVSVGSTFSGGNISVAVSNICGLGAATTKQITPGVNCILSYPSNSSNFRLSQNSGSPVVYPNPSSSDFKISIPNSEDQEIEIAIYDLSGRVIQKIFSKINNDEISFGKELKGGMYFAKLSTAGELVKVFRLEKLN